MVFVIKYRRAVITNEIFNELKVIFDEISERFYIHFHAIGTDLDHLHILVEAAPRYSPSNVMQVCKSITAKEIFKRFPNVKKDLWGGHFWSAGGILIQLGMDMMSNIWKNISISKELLKIKFL